MGLNLDSAQSWYGLGRPLAPTGDSLLRGSSVLRQGENRQGEEQDMYAM